MNQTGQLSLYVLYKLNKGEPFQDKLFLFIKMSKQIPVNGFGVPLYSTSGKWSSKPKVDHLYLNTSGGKMSGDLNMGE